MLNALDEYGTKMKTSDFILKLSYGIVSQGYIYQNKVLIIHIYLSTVYSVNVLFCLQLKKYSPCSFVYRQISWVHVS